MNVVRGDLIKLALDGQFDVIVHGCNCQCTMGAGIAKAIKAMFPEASAADNKTSKGDRKKLGSISFASVTRNGHGITIVNGYTQVDWRGRGVKADQDAIRAVMAHVKRDFGDRKVGYPRIGAGLAGGDWDTISAIINEELDGVDHTLVEYAA
jgi:O-acetyl-ADP-ribose deacetylase (regulator of RNase III)